MVLATEMLFKLDVSQPYGVPVLSPRNDELVILALERSREPILYPNKQYVDTVGFGCESGLFRY
jgi:hypothetical protein